MPAKGVFAGESTARSVSAARLVNMAQAFIAKNLASKISPADVAAPNCDKYGIISGG